MKKFSFFSQFNINKNNNSIYFLVNENKLKRIYKSDNNQNKIRNPNIEFINFIYVLYSNSSYFSPWKSNKKI